MLIIRFFSVSPQVCGHQDGRIIAAGLCLLKLKELRFGFVQPVVFVLFCSFKPVAFKAFMKRYIRDIVFRQGFSQGPPSSLN